MNEANSDDRLSKKESANLTRNTPVDRTKLINELNSDDEAPMRVSDNMMSASLHQKADPDPVGYPIKSKHSSSSVPAEGQLIKAAKTIALGSRDAEIHFAASEDRQASSDRQNGAVNMRRDVFRSGAKDHSISSLHHKPDQGLAVNLDITVKNKSNSIN